MSPASETHASKAQQFLAAASQFQLGSLPTESRHPRTTELSNLAQNDLPAAIELLKDVEMNAFRCFDGRDSDLDALTEEIRATVASGGRIFLGGCGATGRLSLSLETLWREEALKRNRKDLFDRVVSFIAGGDYALVRSIENFEDHPEYGSRQLLDLGFGSEDLMVGCSEGGETPWVIGAVEEAASRARRAPLFLYCNPTETLKRTTECSRRILENPSVRSLAFETGPMAVAGSTRMQATSVLMLAVGAAMFAVLDPSLSARQIVDEHRRALRDTDFRNLAPLIEAESAAYTSGRLCVHRTANYGITVLTDTTERSPTFSLLQFENALEKNSQLSWTYLCHPGSRDPLDSWSKVLYREPRGLDWSSFREKYGQESLLGFNFSPTVINRRSQATGDGKLQIFDIDPMGKEILFAFSGRETRLPRPAHLLVGHLVLKCALNLSSTLVMGRVGRFASNLMLYVRASNMKLIDRAIRYVRILLEDAGITACTYEEVCFALFEIRERLKPDEPIVMRTFEVVRDRYYKRKRA